jgi:hypothetical protein
LFFEVKSYFARTFQVVRKVERPMEKGLPPREEWRGAGRRLTVPNRRTDTCAASG